MSFDIQSVNPYIRVAMRSVITSEKSIKRRVIFDYELIYIESGEFTLNYNEMDYKCREGQFILLRPGVPHSFSEIKDQLSQPHIHFDMMYSVNSRKTPVSFKDINEFTPWEHVLMQKDIFEDYPQLPFVTFSQKEKVLELFYGIMDEKQESGLVQKARLIQILGMLIAENFPNSFLKAENSYSIAHQLKDYMDSEQGMSARLSDFEKQFSYSKYYLERQFKKSYGESIISYRNKKRMETAAKLLRTDPVTGVSEKLGFNSIYAFSRAFKQYFGVAPSKFVDI